eukprot:1093789-Pelagomonas_calceolata.AAC.3
MQAACQVSSIKSNASSEVRMALPRCVHAHAYDTCAHQGSLYATLLQRMALLTVPRAQVCCSTWPFAAQVPRAQVPREICSAQEGRQRGVLPGRARPSPLSSPQEQQQRQQQQQQLLQPLTAGHCATAESVMRPIKGKRLTTQLAPPRDYSHRQWQAEMRDARPERSSFNGPRGRFLSAGGFPGWKFHQSRSQQQQQQQQQQQRVREDFQLCGTTVS